MFEFAFVGIAASGPSLAVSLDAESVSGTAPNGSNQLSTASSTATGQGGSPPYTYEWEHVSGNTSITPASASSASTIWRATGADTVHEAVKRCKVTDNAGVVAFSQNVTVTITQGSP